MTGNCRGPSTAICLLYKFFTMKLTVKQMHGLLTHPDSPYIRAIGFLYLRYVADPKTLWSWYEPYLKDDEEFSPGCDGRMTTMGVYVRDLLLGQYYFDTLFPRVPVLVMRTVVANLGNMKLPTKHCGVTGESARGSEGTSRRPPSVKASLSVSFSQRAPHRVSTRDSSPVRRRTSTPSYDRDHDDNIRGSCNGHTNQTRDLSDRDFSSSRDRDRKDDYNRRSRDSYRRDSSDRSSREGGSRRSRSRNRSESIYEKSRHDQNRPNPPRRESKEKLSAYSNLAKLKDLYGGDLRNNQKEDVGPTGASGTEEVIRLGGSSWR